MKIDLSVETLKSIADIEESYGKLGIVVNDIYSFDKELRLWNEKHQEGGHLLNMVQQMTDDTGCSFAAAKRILWVLCREWELEHHEMVLAREAASSGCSEELKAYLKALEYVLGGNEVWSETTERYHERL